MSMVNPDSVNSIKADVTVTETEFTDSNVRLRARLHGFFYRDTTDHDIHAQMGIRCTQTGGCEGYYRVLRCYDEQCGPDTSDVLVDMTISSTDFAPVLGGTYTLSLSWDGATQFTFDFGVLGVPPWIFDTTSVDPNAAYDALPVSKFKGFGTRVSHTAGPDSGGYIAAIIDNAQVNGDLYDDFNDPSGMIDDERWNTWEFVRHIDNGMLESALTRHDSNGGNNLNLIDPQYVNGFQADVTVTDVQGSGTLRPRARLVGAFYNDGTIGTGRAGDIIAGVIILHNGAELRGGLHVTRCLAGDCNLPGEAETIYSDTDTFGSVVPNTTHTLSLHPSDAEGDLDNDGWTNLQEYQGVTDPQNEDNPAITEVFVGGTGADDKNLGNTGNPVATIHTAVDRINNLAEDSYTIQVTTGTYSVATGEADEPISLTQSVMIEGAGAVIDGTGATNWATGIMGTVGSTHITLNGITIQNFDTGIRLITDGGCLDMSGVEITACSTGLQLIESYQVTADLGGSRITACETGIEVAAGSSNNVIRNVIVINNTGDGVLVDGSNEVPDENIFDTLQVQNNAGNGIGILGGCGNQVINSDISGNNTSNQGYGGVAFLEGNGLINFSVISGNHCYGVYAADVLAGNPVDAMYNWWGNATGPSGVGPGDGDGVSENVIYAPWLGEVDPWIGQPPPPDTDGDGLGDDWETQHGLDPSLTDTNSDGIPDSAEDPDNDGWTNLQEFQAGTNPNIDTDYPILTTFYVGFADADDANLGSPSYPLKTLHAAVARINSLHDDNYTIHVATGTYSVATGEDDEVLTVEQNLTIIGSGLDNTVLDGTGASLWTAGLVVSVGAEDVTIQGLTIQNFEKGIGISTDAACLALTGVVIEGCDIGLDIRENYMLEVDLGDAEIRGCGTGVLVTAGSSNNTITNGMIHDNSGDGISVKSCDEDPDENLFEEIQVLNNAVNGIVLDGGFCNQVTNCVITGNNTSETGYGGVVLLSGSAKVNENDIMGNNCFGVYSNEPVDAMNNWWGDESGPSGVGPGSGDAVSVHVIYKPWFGYTEAYEPVEYDDVDDDGLPDWWEEFHFGSTGVVNDPDGDYDGDGITNQEEYEAGSDPNNPVSVEITNPAANPTYTGFRRINDGDGQRHGYT